MKDASIGSLLKQKSKGQYVNPVKIWVEDEYVRAVRGGIGFTKTGGNYVASMKAQEKAHEEGYSQVLWLDGVERKIDVNELYEAHSQSKLEEIWGSGTAAVISPVGALRWKDQVMTISNGQIGPLSQRLYDTVTGIIEDKHSWTVEVK